MGHKLRYFFIIRVHLKFFKIRKYFCIKYVAFWNILQLVFIQAPLLGQDKAHQQ